MLPSRGLGWRFRALQLALLALACAGLPLVSSGVPALRDRADGLAASITRAWHDGLHLIERPFARTRPLR